VTPPLQRGEFVQITTDTGRTVAAMVGLASPNGRSIILLFDAMIGGWAGQLPAFLDEDGRWAALDGMPLQIVRQLKES
jgi:hypothetical protein